MSDFRFTSRLSHQYREELERLLFFNKNQSRSSDMVEFVARRYGIPRVNVEGETLRVELASNVSTQTLFAVESSAASAAPVGVVVYTRQEDTLLALFIAVHEDFSSRGAQRGRNLMLWMFHELKAIALRVRGVATLSMYVGRSEPTRLRLDRT